MQREAAASPARRVPKSATGHTSGSEDIISKGDTILRMLLRKDGATIAEMAEVTGWQAHSLRGFLSGSLKKRKGIDIVSGCDGNGLRRYRIASQAARRGS